MRRERVREWCVPTLDVWSDIWKGYPGANHSSKVSLESSRSTLQTCAIKFYYFAQARQHGAFEVERTFPVSLFHTLGSFQTLWNYVFRVPRTKLRLETLFSVSRTSRWVSVRLCLMTATFLIFDLCEAYLGRGGAIEPNWSSHSWS